MGIAALIENGTSCRMARPRTRSRSAN